ncbi:MAG: efflux RND transporter periplasmic adaptor subunit, partial [Balneolales bacterium]|nr:efflux RND transporter periplasmic adaptor subunit [Balneolales bacterium]
INVVSVPIQAVTVRDFAKDKPTSDEEGENSEEAEVQLASDSDVDDLLIEREDIRKVVFKVVDGKAIRTEVETGISDNTHIQITSGLNAGEEIVIGGYRVLSRTLENDEAVEVTNAPNDEEED